MTELDYKHPIIQGGMLEAIKRVVRYGERVSHYDENGNKYILNDM